MYGVFVAHRVGGEDDGGAGSVGLVTRYDSSDNSCEVRWPDGTEGDWYDYEPGSYEVCRVLGVGAEGAATGAASSMPQVPSHTHTHTNTHYIYYYTHTVLTLGG